MNYLVCIDDTDMPGTKGTGWLAQELCEKLDSSLARKELIVFGKMAKQAVTSKAAAYDLARQSGIHLSEHGGTGDGVVGAVAIGSEKTKTVRMGSRQVVVVLKNEEMEKTGIEYRTITKQEAKQY